jgi:hypothetical protein
MLVSGLGSVICEGPVDEIVDLADESDVVVDRAIVIGRPQQGAVLAGDPRA